MSLKIFSQNFHNTKALAAHISTAREAREAATFLLTPTKSFFLESLLCTPSVPSTFNLMQPS